jgi:hypothetical protein
MAIWKVRKIDKHTCKIASCAPLICALRCGTMDTPSAGRARSSSTSRLTFSACMCGHSRAGRRLCQRRLGNVDAPEAALDDLLNRHDLLQYQPQWPPRCLPPPLCMADYRRLLWCQSRTPLLCWPSSPTPRYDPARVRGKVAAQGRKVARMPRCYGYRDFLSLQSGARKVQQVDSTRMEADQGCWKGDSNSGSSDDVADTWWWEDAVGWSWRIRYCWR